MLQSGGASISMPPFASQVCEVQGIGRRPVKGERETAIGSLLTQCLPVLANLHRMSAA